MQRTIMCFVCRFVPQQKAVRPCRKIRFIFFPFPLPDGKRNRTIGVFLTHRTDNMRHFFLRKIQILAALQNEGTKAEGIPLFTAGKDFLLRQPIAFQSFVPSADTAVIAVISAIIRKFNQPSNIDIPAVMLMANVSRLCKKIFRQIRRSAIQQGNPLRLGEGFFSPQFVN